jgi:hypothetical protein
MSYKMKQIRFESLIETFIEDLDMGLVRQFSTWAQYAIPMLGRTQDSFRGN